MLQILINGFLLGLSLIAAIGAQNMFVIKQGLGKNHIFAVCLLCFLCDATLMSVAVFGVGKFLGENEIFAVTLAMAGALFLLCYGAMNFIAAYRGEANMGVDERQNASPLTKTLTKTLAVTLLNPHVYLDTVVMAGGVAVSVADELKLLFLIGLVMASGVWFFALGYAANRLSYLFASPKMWQILNAVVGCVMFYIAWLLIKFVLQSSVF